MQIPAEQPNSESEKREWSKIRDGHLIIDLQNSEDLKRMEHLSDSALIALVIKNLDKISGLSEEGPLIRIMAEGEDESDGMPFAFSFTLSIDAGQITVENKNQLEMGHWKTEVSEDGSYVWQDIRSEDAQQNSFLPVTSKVGLRQFLSSLLIETAPKIPPLPQLE